MKILHVLSQRPDSTGSGIYLQAMLREAASKGHNSSLVAAMNHEEQQGATLPAHAETSLVSFDTAELDFALPGMSDVMPYPSSRFIDMTMDQLEHYEQAFYQRISLAIKRHRPDLIHSHHLWLLTSMVKKQWPDIPLVASCHGSDLRQFRLCPHLQDRVLEGCRTIDHIFALTEEQKKEIALLYSFPENSTSVIGAGYNDALFQYAEKPPVPPVHIVYCGKLSRSKGVLWLLRALHHLGDIDFHFHLVGSGSGPEKLECLRQAEKLGQRLTIHGVMDQKELAALLKQSHIFVLPSLYEGLPLVILEALACGCRIVATDIPGCRIIRDITAPQLISLIPIPELTGVDQIAPAGESRFISDIATTLANCCRTWIRCPSPEEEHITRAVAPFTWKHIFEKVEKQYLQILSQQEAPIGQ